MGCFPCFGSTREEELKYYGSKGPGGGNGGGGRATASSSSSAAAGGGGGRVEEAVVAPPRAQRGPAGACCLCASPSLPENWDPSAWFVVGIGTGSGRGLMLRVSLFAVVGLVRMERLILVHVDVIEGNDRNDSVFPSDLFTVLLEGGKGIDLYLQIQKRDDNPLIRDRDMFSIMISIFACLLSCWGMTVLICMIM
jgi:hypothetical protein